MENRLGQQFGDYRLIKFLGSGANGDVYLGQSVHTHEDPLVAVKVLKTPLKDRDDAKQFIKEVNTIFRLNHPHIIQLLAFDIAGDDYPFLVMSYAANGTLRNRHPRGSQLPPSLVVNYVKQIAAALQHAHTHRVVHRDIKPDNILLGPGNEIWLSDFGIAIIAHRVETWVTQDVAGTAAYMAPEQFQAKAEPASDQYALGVIVYEWLCGDRPFHGDFAQLFQQHNFIPPPPLCAKVPALSPQAEQVVLKALAKDPQQRFPSIEAFSTALEQALLPPRKIALFGYETGGGRNAVLWRNPQAFFSDAQYSSGYAAWSKTKRSFTRDEVLDGIWIKASDTGNYYQVHFHSDGRLTESALLDASIRWGGTWELLDEVLRVNIGGYELDILANAEGLRHSGIEFYQNEEAPDAYFTILHVPGWNKKRWDDMDEVVALVHRMYEQVLTRRADESGLITYGAMLYRGEKSVREIVKILGLSPEYRKHFIEPKPMDAAVALCYEDFLGRSADIAESAKGVSTAQAQGFAALITTLLESQEYKTKFNEDLVPPKMLSGLTVASMSPNHLEYFYRGLDNHLWHRWCYDNEWRGEGDLGNILTSPPAAISRGSDRMDCFYRGEENQLWHRYWNGSDWSHPENLGGILTSAPAVASWGPDRLDCFVRGQNYRLYQKWWDGSTWRGWVDLGGILMSSPAVVSWGPNRIDCFVRNSTEHLAQKWWDGSTWRGWVDLGGLLTSAPAVVSLQPNHLECFYRGRDHRLWHRWWDGSRWSEEMNLGGGILTSAPAAIARGPSHIDCFYRGQDQQLWHRWWDGSGWSKEEKLGGALV